MTEWETGAAVAVWTGSGKPIEINRAYYEKRKKRVLIERISQLRDLLIGFMEDDRGEVDLCGDMRIPLGIDAAPAELDFPSHPVWGSTRCSLQKMRKAQLIDWVLDLHSFFPVVSDARAD